MILLLRKPTSFKNPENAYCIDFKATKFPNSFQNSFVIETGLCDFHKLTATISKTKSEKLKPRIEYYKDYKTKTFTNNKFKDYLLSELSMENTRPSEQGFPHSFLVRDHFDQNHQKLHENC